MPDLTLCPGTGCPLAARCRRHTATPDPHWQSWLATPPYDAERGECHLYLPGAGDETADA